MEYMLDSFEEWAEIMKITKDHPNYEAYKMVWDMARLPKPKVEDAENKVICGAV